MIDNIVIFIIGIITGMLIYHATNSNEMVVRFKDVSDTPTNFNDCRHCDYKENK